MGAGRWLLPMAGASAAALAILSPTAVSPFAATVLAQTQARLSICPSLDSALAGQFSVQSLQMQREGFTVYYTSLCMDGTDTVRPSEGFRVFRRGGMRWDDAGGEDISYYDAGCFMPTVSGQVVCCAVSTGEEGQYTAIFGRSVSPNVATVEADFSNGDVGRMALVKDKFAIVTPALVTAASLRLYDINGKLLHERTLDLEPSARSTGSTGCVP